MKADLLASEGPSGKGTDCRACSCIVNEEEKMLEGETSVSQRRDIEEMTITNSLSIEPISPAVKQFMRCDIRYREEE